MPGFERPGVTTTPDAFFDYWLARLSGPELRVLLYAIRHTYGWARPSDDISLDQFMSGMRTADGTGLDEGTGLARTTILKSIKALCALGLLEKTRQRLVNRDWVSNFRVVIDESIRHNPSHVFQPGRVTKVPDELFDYWLPVARLSDPELRVLLYIIRRTMGFGKRADIIAPEQFLHGITTRKGTQLDGGCGLAKKALYQGLKGLEAKGLIAIERRKDPRKGNVPARYSLVFVGEEPAFLDDNEPDPRQHPDPSLDGDGDTPAPAQGEDVTHSTGERPRRQGGTARTPRGDGRDAKGGRLAPQGGTARTPRGDGRDARGERGEPKGLASRANPQETDSTSKQETPEQEDVILEGNDEDTQQQGRAGVVVLQSDEAIRAYPLADDEVFMDEEGVEDIGTVVRVITLKDLVQRDIEATARNWGIRVTAECYYSADHVLGTGPEEWTPDEQRKLEYRSALRRDLEAMYADTGAFTVEEALATYFTADIVATLQTDDPAERERQRGWISYIRSEAGKNLTSPAGFLRKQLASRQWPPRGAPPPRRR